MLLVRIKNLPITEICNMLTQFLQIHMLLDGIKPWPNTEICNMLTQF